MAAYSKAQLPPVNGESAVALERRRDGEQKANKIFIMASQQATIRRHLEMQRMNHTLGRDFQHSRLKSMPNIISRHSQATTMQWLNTCQ
jgi:hypothetical protein